MTRRKTDRGWQNACTKCNVGVEGMSFVFARRNSRFWEVCIRMSLSLDISRKQWEDRKIYGHFRSIDILSKSEQMHVSHSEVEYWIACFPYRLYFTNTLWTSRVIFSEQKKCMRSLIIDWTVDEKEFHFLWGWKVERVATISIIEAVNILARGT